MNVRFRFALSALCVVFLGLLAPSVTRADDLVTNGDFSYTGNPGYDWTLIYANEGSDFYFNTGYAAFGAVSTDYDTITQKLDTLPDYEYTLSFELENEVSTSAADFQVLWNGAEVLDVPGTDPTDIGAFTPYSVNVVGVGDDTLGFAGLQNPSWYNLTDVSVSPAGVTPEPSSLLLLGTGLAALGGLVRRKLKA